MDSRVKCLQFKFVHAVSCQRYIDANKLVRYVRAYPGHKLHKNTKITNIQWLILTSGCEWPNHPHQHAILSQPKEI